MALVQRATGASTPASTGTSISITKPAGLAVGDLMIAHVYWRHGSGVNTPSGWTLINSIVRSTTNSMGVFWKFATSSDVAASSFSFTSPGSAGNQGQIYAFSSGYDTSSPIDQSNTGSYAAGAPVISAITPTVANATIMQCWGVQDDTGVPYSSFAIATSDPGTWVHLGALGSTGSNSGIDASFSGTRTQTTSTGNGTATQSVSIAGVGIMFNIKPLGNSTPTITPNTADGTSFNTLTPKLLATGNDTESDDLRYEFNVFKFNYSQDFSSGALPTGWAEYGNEAWTYTGGIATQSTVGSGDPQKVLYTASNFGGKQQRIVQTEVTFNTVSTGTDDRVGITILGQSSDGKGVNLIYNGSNGLRFLEDGIQYQQSAAWAPTVGQTWIMKGMYLNGIFYGKKWLKGTTEPSTWDITWAHIPASTYLYSGITGNSSSHTTKCSYDNFSVVDANYIVAVSNTDLTFANQNNGADTDPFTAGDQIGFTITGERLDAHQDITTSSFGFGQIVGTRYRGQVFVPTKTGAITKIGFDRVKGSTDIKVYLDTVDSSHFPVHSVGSALYAFTITNANLVNGYGEYNLPTPLDVTAGTEYCFYLAPWDIATDVYFDDYQDCHGASPGSYEINNNTGTWSLENISLHYAIYIDEKLEAGNTYSWQARVSDPNGSNTWSSYTTLRSFIVSNVNTYSLTKSMQYTVKRTPSALTKSLKYTTKTTHSAIIKSLQYAVVTTPTNSIDLQQTASSGGAYVGNPGSNLYAAQTFSPTSSGRLYGVSLFLAKTGAPTDNIQAYIYDTDGSGNPRNLLYTSDNAIAGSSLPVWTSSVQADFTFKNSPVLLTAGTLYAIVVKRTGTNDASNNYVIVENSAGGYAGGQFFINTDGTTWTAESAYDLKFSTSMFKALFAKQLSYAIILKTTTQLTKSLQYAVKKTQSGLIKSLQYATGKSNQITKGLQYAIRKTQSVITKGLQYAIRKANPITKPLQYEVKTTKTAITKNLQYAIKKGNAITKSIQYSIKISHSAITKSLQYDIRKSSVITKSIQYTIKFPHAAITKGLQYAVKTTGSALTKPLAYIVKNQGTITKSLQYAIPTTLPAMTKALAYYIRKTPALTKSLQYAVKKGNAITKGFQYAVKKSMPITKSLKYTIPSTVPALQLSLAYYIDKTHVLTKSVQYVIKSPVAIMKLLTYSLPASSSTIQKTLRYMVKTPHTAITKSSRYAVKKGNAVTKSLQYTVRAAHAAVTKALQYMVKRPATALTKSLRYAIVKNFSITKSLQYTIKATHGAITKSLKYALKQTPSGITKALQYSIKKGVAITKPLQYTVKKAATAITKPLQYVLPKSTIVITKTLEYSTISSMVGWRYQKKVTVNNASGGALSNYQTFVIIDPTGLISGGKMRSDYGDIRITAADGLANLDYWIDPDTKGGSSLVIWFKASNLPVGNTDFYLYYGNPSAVSAENGANVFVYFDDFSTNTIGNYSTTGGTVSVDTTNKQMKLTGVNSSNTLAVPTIQTDPGSYIAEADVLIQNVQLSSDWGGGLLGFKSTNFGTDGYVAQFFSFSGGTKKVDVEQFNAAHLVNTAISFSEGVYYPLRATFVSGSITSLFNNATSVNSSSTSYTSGKYGMRGFNVDAYFRNFRVRLYVATEPTQSLGSEMILVPSIEIKKTLQYVIRAPHAITKGLQYAIKKPPTALTKSLRYAIRKAQPINKSLHYVIKSPVRITKSLVYKIVSSHPALTKVLTYKITSPSIVKYLSYYLKVGKYIEKYIKKNTSYTDHLSSKNTQYGEKYTPKDTTYTDKYE